MRARGELLERACRRIVDLDRPAYVKNSELRYVAVNEAYAALFRRDVSDFIGNRSREIFDRPEEEDREDKERRALVFGTEETTIYFDPSIQARHRLQIESFTPSDDSVYILGLFQETAEPRVAAPRQISPLPKPSSTVMEGALDLVEVGICIFDADNRLVYANANWLDSFKPIIGKVEIGTPLRSVLERVHRYRSENLARNGQPTIDRETWIAEQWETFAKPHSEVIEKTIRGRWVRLVNKRLSDGSVIGLRIDITDMKEQELLLRQHINETDLFRTILEDLPVAIFVRNSDHRLIYANEYFFKNSRFPRDRAMNKTELEMFSDSGKILYDQNAAVLADGRLLEFEEAIPREDGQPYPAMKRVNRVITAQGEPYVVGSFTDISILKLREEQILEARAEAESLHRELEIILRSLPVGIMILGADLTVDYVNDTFYSMWGFPTNDPLEGKSLRQLIEHHYVAGRYGDSSADVDAVYQARVAAFQADENSQIELSYADGKSVVLDSRKLSNGRIVVSYADISQVRVRENEIQETRRELERLGGMMQDATHAMAQGLLIMRDGAILLSNDVLPEILKVPTDLLVPGESWSKLFQFCAERGDLGDEPELLLRSWQESVAAREPISTVFQVDGERWVSLESAISDQEHWISTFTDITEMKKRETDLQGLLSRAEAADRAKSEFLANMSHEIRTPMNGVLGMAELLAKTDLDARQKTFIDIIGKSGNALLTIINDILDFSKIDAGQMTLKKAVFDPGEAIEDVTSLLSSHASEKDIELLVRLEPSLPAAVMGDAGRFRQVVTNLVGNAVKFTEKGHILVEASCRTGDGEDAMLTVRVADTGIGIPTDMLETIFEKFSQVDTSSTRRHEGTGLGLAITAGLIDLFGGYMEVDSEANKGSVFTVHLPFATAELRQEPKGVPINVKGARILVIDDNAINRHILNEQLQIWGFDGVAAEDGATGLAILEAAADLGAPVDAVILDYHMPDMNGAQVARLIREHEKFHDVAIIFLTSMEGVGSDKEFVATIGQAHLMKPARANVLRNTVIEVVRAARTGQAVLSGRMVSDHNVLRPVPLSSPAKSRHTAQTAPQEKIDILVAEDNEVNQIVFTQILQATGLRFMVVGNGRDAVDAWEEHHPALIMMDVSMPVMNGHQATRSIRASERQSGLGAHVPIIGVTAHALDSDRDLCIDAGMDDYMSKPISPELLEAKIRNWLTPEHLVGDGSLFRS